MLVRKSPAEVELLRESGRWCAHAHRLLEQYTRVGCDRGGGEPARPAGDDARDARGARLTRAARLRRRREGGLPRPDRPAAAPGRTLSRTTSSSSRATCSSRRRVRRSGATRQSSSAPSSSARRPTACDGCSTTCSVRGRQRSRRSCPARRAPTSTARSWTTSPGTTSSATGASTPGTARGFETTRRPFLDVGDPTPLEPGMVFTIEPGLYDPEVGGFRHSDTVVVTESGLRPPHRLPERSREPDASRLSAPQRTMSFRVVVVGCLADHRDRVGALAEEQRLADADVLDRAVRRRPSGRPRRR